MTITQAIKTVMLAKQAPLTAREAYDAIIEARLYIFHADNPAAVVASQIRRHCVGLDFPSASETKYFEHVGEGKYIPLPSPIKIRPGQPSPAKASSKRSVLRELKQLHKQYEEEVRKNVLGQLKKLDPYTFERFSMKLLEAYGFIDMHVTQVSRDGGIDGYGKLKVGLAHLNVAFQCKRYTTSSVGRPEIDKFRGAIQGQFEQGLFFTTSSFAPGAAEASFRPGAVPIILIDGNAIIDLMIEKQFGIQVENIQIYSYALDLVFAEDNTA